jgi:general secretion pathway protein G
MRTPKHPVTLNLFQGPCEPVDAGHDDEGRAWMLKRVQHDEGEKGFTLVELMVVIVIIGLLATIVVINVLPSGDKAKEVRAKADISTIEGALETYRLQLDNYPTTAQGLDALRSPPQGVDASRYQPGGYIKKLQNDPWGRPYLYQSPGRHGEFDVWSYGRDGKEGGEGPDADITSWQ